MSKVVIDEYVCTVLEYMRKMPETGDYSQLPAFIERAQQHFNAMESGLNQGRDFRWSLINICNKDELSSDEFKDKVLKIMEPYLKNKNYWED